MFDKTKFMSFYNGTPYQVTASRCFDLVYNALTSLGIYSDLVMIGSMATIRTEVGKMFLPVIENDSGAQYNGRMDLGNTQTGDGPLFKGRGFIQLTGRSNYTAYANKLTLDLVNHPDIALAPYEAAQILAQYFKDKGCDIACNSQDWTKVRQLVNGGTNGLDVFLSVVNQYSN